MRESFATHSGKPSRNTLPVFRWSELHPPANADPHPRFVAILARARNPKTNAAEFMHLRTYTSDPARVPGTYGDSMLAKITRNISVQGTDGETDVSEGYDIHTSDGGSIHFAADYKRPMPLWTYTTPVDPNTAVINSTVGPPLRRVYWEDAQTCVMVSQGLNVNVPHKLEINVNLVDLADVTQDAHLVAMLIRPCYTRRVFVAAGLKNGGGGE